VNAAIVRIADEFGVPLWNFWLAVQPLPNHGLQEDGFHLTFARNLFDDPSRSARRLGSPQLDRAASAGRCLARRALKKGRQSARTDCRLILQTMAEMPVISRPTTSVLISFVPS
jgi:hypothetical protein